MIHPTGDCGIAEPRDLDDFQLRLREEGNRI